LESTLQPPVKSTGFPLCSNFNFMDSITLHASA